MQIDNISSENSFNNLIFTVPLALKMLVCLCMKQVLHSQPHEHIVAAAEAFIHTS